MAKIESVPASYTFTLDQDEYDGVREAVIERAAREGNHSITADLAESLFGSEVWDDITRHPEYTGRNDRW